MKQHCCKPANCSV